MRRCPRLLVPGTVVLLCALCAGFAVRTAAQEPTAVAVKTATPSLTPEAMEEFLQKGKIIARRDTGSGVTDTIRATLSNGTLTHDAQIQTVDVAQTTFSAGKATELNFKDSYRYNIGGYKLARLLGMNNVPMSVERRIEAKMAAMTWWIDDVILTEKDRVAKQTAGPSPLRTTQQLLVMRVFDELIQNRDRNQGNILWTSDWKMWLIDHTRAFRTGKELMKPEDLTRCDRALLQRLREVTPEQIQKALEGTLTRPEIEGVVARRALIVKHFDERIAKLGEAVVIYELNPPLIGPS